MALDSDLFLTILLQRYKLDPWFKFGDFASSTQPADTDVQQVQFVVRCMCARAHAFVNVRVHVRS